MKRLVATTLGLALLATACAGSASGSLGPAPTGPGASPSPSETPAESPPASPTDPSPSPSPEPPSDPFTFEVWFADPNGRLFVTQRTEEFDPGVARLAMNALLAAPNEAERSVGVTSTVPPGTELLGLDLSAQGVITVDLSTEFETPSGSAAETMRLAQVVHTLTQYRTVDSVLFEVEGDPVSSFGSHGIVLDGSQTREDFADLLPAILVESPVVGSVVSSPVTVAGSANVFEATVSLRIVLADGTEIARTFTTATCGTGCRGEYSARVSYRVDRPQPGVIEVFESSAKDGSPVNVVRIPVTLT